MFAHIDADSFFASVLQRKHPHLRGKPLLALGMGGGCVIAASYEAKDRGVKTGMRVVEARKLCPGAIEIASDFAETGVASHQIEGILCTICPLIEKMSIDEWFLDLTTVPGGIPENLDSWAKEKQQDITTRVGISVSIGIASTKLLAKMASEYRKPAGITIVCTSSSLPLTPSQREGGLPPPSGEGWGGGNPSFSIQNSSFLKDRPAAAIPGIGRKRGTHAEHYNWNTAWDIATADSDLIIKLFGRPGREMQLELLGTPVHSIEVDPRPPKSVSRCRSFRKTNNRELIFATLLHHLSYTVQKMRRHNLMCTSLAVWLRDGRYHHFGRDTKLPQPMHTEEQILPYLKRLFERLYQDKQYYTQAGLALFGLKPQAAVQYSLFEDPRTKEKEESIQTTLDALHTKHGRDSIVRGAALPTTSGTKKELSIFKG